MKAALASAICVSILDGPLGVGDSAQCSTTPFRPIAGLRTVDRTITQWSFDSLKGVGDADLDGRELLADSHAFLTNVENHQILASDERTAVVLAR